MERDQEIANVIGWFKDKRKAFIEIVRQKDEHTAYKLLEEFTDVIKVETFDLIFNDYVAIEVDNWTKLIDEEAAKAPNVLMAEKLQELKQEIVDLKLKALENELSEARKSVNVYSEKEELLLHSFLKERIKLYSNLPIKEEVSVKASSNRAEELLFQLIELLQKEN